MNVVACFRKLIAIVVLTLLLLGAGTATAQSVTSSTFRAIERVQDMMSEDRNQEAIAELKELLEKTRRTPYDFAVASQYLAHNYVILDDMENARSALEAAMALPKLPPDLMGDLQQLYASIILRFEEFELAANVFDDWLAIAEEPTASQLFNAGYANYRSDRLERAEELLLQAIEMDEDKAQSSWYQVYYRVLFDLKRYDEAKDLLYGLINRKPLDPINWRLLASHYLQLEENNEALAAVMIAYMQNQLEQETDLKQIISLFDFIRAPEKAARMLETWMQEGRVETNAETTRKLGNLWLVAREADKAEVALLEAARLAPDGGTFALLGGIYFENEEWQKAYDAYNRALKLGGLETPYRISLLSGISAYWAGNYKEARESLVYAAESADYRAQARSLIRKIDEG